MDNKYKWHDLTKNPDDLPNNDEGQILVAYKYIVDNSIGYEIVSFTTDLYKVDNYDFSEYSNKKRKAFYEYDNEMGFYEVINVTAWKHIEPFGSELEK